MKFHLGPNIEQPTIAARLTPDDLADLQSMKGCSESYDELEQRGHISLSETEDGTELSFLFKKIGRRPAARHETLLKPTVELIDCLSICENADDYAMEITGLSSVRDTSARLELSARLKWPEASSSAIEELTSTVMKNIAYQLRYDLENKGPRGVKIKYEDHVGATVDRDGTRTGQPGVTLQTNPMQSASIDTPAHIYFAEEPHFNLQAHNLYSHKQQLICLAGAIAIATADELVNQ